MSAQQVAYKRSPIVRVAKAVLYPAHRMLPTAAYNSLYGAGRQALWLFQRAAYKARVLRARFAGDGERLRKLELVSRLLPYTMGGPLALDWAFEITSRVERESIRGALVECGVARGGCSAMMALASKHYGGARPLWLFDSYEGLPDPTADDFRNGAVGEVIGPITKGMLVGTVQQVSHLMFDTCGLDRRNVEMVKGWFQDTLPANRSRVGAIALLRLDGDWYESTKCCLENLFDQVTPGGYVIIDDYGTCYGCEKAVTEFLEARGLTVELMPDGRGGAWFKKPTA